MHIFKLSIEGRFIGIQRVVLSPGRKYKSEVIFEKVIIRKVKMFLFNRSKYEYMLSEIS